MNAQTVESGPLSVVCSGGATPEFLYVVFCPALPLSGNQWSYGQTMDGAVWRQGSIGGRGTWHEWAGAPSRLDAWWCARTFSARHFESREADEIYTPLANAAMWAEKGETELVRHCLDHVMAKCRQWQERLAKEERV